MTTTMMKANNDNDDESDNYDDNYDDNYNELRWWKLRLRLMTTMTNDDNDDYDDDYDWLTTNDDYDNDNDDNNHYSKNEHRQCSNIKQYNIFCTTTSFYCSMIILVSGRTI